MTLETDPLEQAIEEARKALPEEVGNRLAAYIDGLESQLSASRSEHREDEDAACRLEELRVKAGLPEGSPEEIAGNVGTIIELQVKALAASRSEVQALREALRELVHQVEISDAVDDHGHALENLQALHVARSALSASQASTSAPADQPKEK